MTKSIHRKVILALAAFWLSSGAGPSLADSTSARLSAFYDRKMMLCGQTAFQWRGDDPPIAVADGISQVGVGRDASYVLTTSGRLLTWEEKAEDALEILSDVRWFAAGRSGVFAIRSDGDLVYVARPTSWFGEGELAQPRTVRSSVTTAAIGDSADYFVTEDGTLHVKGLAHRWQYGDGKLTESEG